MKEQAIKNINKIGKVSYIAAVVAKSFVVVGLVASLLVSILCFTVLGDKVKMGMTGQVDLEMDCEALDINYEELDAIDEDDMTVKQQKLQIGNAQVGTVVSISEKDYKSMDVEIKDGTMFAKLESEEISFTAKDFGVLMILASISLIMTIVTISFAQSLCKEFRDCTSPFDSKVIKKMQNLAISLIPWTIISSVINSTVDSFMKGGLQLSFTLDLGVVLVVLIVFVLVYIFKYGAVLQQESDETL